MPKTFYTRTALAILATTATTNAGSSDSVVLSDASIADS